jgi:hypothetical protein
VVPVNELFGLKPQRLAGAYRAVPMLAWLVKDKALQCANLSG